MTFFYNEKARKSRPVRVFRLKKYSNPKRDVFATLKKEKVTMLFSALRKISILAGLLLFVRIVPAAETDEVQQMLQLQIAVPNASLREKLVGKRIFEILFSSHYQKYKITPEM